MMQTRSQSGKSVANGHAARQRIWLWHSADDSAELLSLLYNAQTKEQIDVVGTRHKVDTLLGPKPPHIGRVCFPPRLGPLVRSVNQRG